MQTRKPLEEPVCCVDRCGSGHPQKVHAASNAPLVEEDSTSHLISWALSWDLRGRSFIFLQSRNSWRLVNGSWLIEHLSMSFHTSTPTSTIRMFRGL